MNTHTIYIYTTKWHRIVNKYAISDKPMAHVNTNGNLNQLPFSVDRVLVREIRNRNFPPYVYCVPLLEMIS